MNYSIDIKHSHGIISGWAATDEHLDLTNAEALIYHTGRLIKKSSLSLQRNDVRQAGLHHNGLCGFVFENIQNNKIYDIHIKSSHEELKKTFFLGELEPAIRAFVSFELERDDLTIMEPSTHELQETNGDFLLIKKLLIRLRRHKRAKGFRGEFTGVPYDHRETDWELFDRLINTYHKFLFSTISTRYLWSFTDTYADFGKPNERLAALAITNLFSQERFAQTFHCMYDFIPKENPVTHTQLPYWDGMGTNRLRLDDSYEVFLTRNLEVLSATPIIKIFFKEFVRRSMSHPDSIMRFNVDNSDYFKSVLSYYMSNLNQL